MSILRIRGVLPAFVLVSVATLAWGCGGGGGSRVPGVPTTSQLVNSLEAGDPQIPAAAGYTGSAACITCHGDLYRTFEKTAHHRGLRTTGRPGVDGVAVHANLDGRGRDDFREGLNLVSLPAFSAFGADAPRLLRVAGEAEPYKVSIGGVVYAVARVYGGQRREDYLLRVGDSLYPAPFEWDERLGDYVPLETETWYDGTDARFASESAARGGIDREASFERRCAGCHHSGFQVSFEDGHWKTGYTELGVGCESCHGPGANHVLSNGDPDDILNPRDLEDGTALGRERVDAVCAQCHTRGTGFTLPGAPSPVEYALDVEGAFRPGSILDGYIEPTTDPADYWAYKDNPLSPVPS
ncbi:MAG: multiheme c-type cytochrome, partial [Planctomycetota bacterium]